LKSKASFTQRVKAKVQSLKSDIPIDAKVEMSPEGFTLGVKAELEKIFSICPNLLINVELYNLVLAPRVEKRIPTNLGSQFATLWANFHTFINVTMSMF